MLAADHGTKNHGKANRSANKRTAQNTKTCISEPLRELANRVFRILFFFCTSLLIFLDSAFFVPYSVDLFGILRILLDFEVFSHKSTINEACPKPARSPPP